MLVAAFEIEIGNRRILGFSGAEREVARSRLEPDVEDVHFLFERRAAAVRALCPGHEHIGFRRVPAVGSLGGEELLDLAVDGFIRDRLAALLAKKYSDR